MPVRAARVGRVGVVGAPVAKTAVVAKAVTPGPSPVAKSAWWPHPHDLERVRPASDKSASRSGSGLLAQNDACSRSHLGASQRALHVSSRFEFLRMCCSPSGTPTSQPGPATRTPSSLGGGERLEQPPFGEIT